MMTRAADAGPGKGFLSTQPARSNSMSTEQPTVLGHTTAPLARAGQIRWLICALLFAATTINYVDRQSLATLKSTLQDKLHFDEASYGWMNFAFTAGYAVMYVFAGRFIDWMGTRRGLAWAVVVWSLACMSHALVQGAVGFAVARFVLAMGEAANFPAAIKTTAQWFPKKERALATGLFNSGSNIGLMITPAIAYMALHLGWQSAFIAVGLLGLLWLAWWLAVYQAPEKYPRLTKQELAYIQQDRDAGSAEMRNVHWTVLLRQRQAWPFLIGKFLTDPVWWFFLAWMPSYLKDERHMSVLSGATALLIPYTAAAFGSILGGYISSACIKRGLSVAAGRYVAMGLCAIGMPVSIYAGFASHAWVSITLISVAMACHQGWSANLFTTATDMFPSAVAGSVTGLGGTAGAIGGMLMNLLAGAVIQYTHHYGALFIWAGCMHPISLILYLVTVGTARTRADMIHEQHGVSVSLLVGGSIITMLGAVGLVLVDRDWTDLRKAMKGLSGAAAGATAGGFIVFIGLLLVYAALDRRTIAAPAK
jgi:ACS family hexuronate transporter-like MFS transporter